MVCETNSKTFWGNERKEGLCKDQSLNFWMYKENVFLEKSTKNKIFLAVTENDEEWERPLKMKGLTINKPQVRNSQTRNSMKCGRKANKKYMTTIKV